VLQEGEYTTVGGRTPIKTDVRIIAATHRELKTQIQQGLFPRGPVLSAQRGAAAHPAAAGAPGGTSATSCATSCVWPPRPVLGHKSIETAAIERLKHYHLARQTCASSRTWCAGWPRCTPEDTLTADNRGRRSWPKPCPPPTAEGGKTAQGPVRGRSSATWRDISPGYGRELPPPGGLYDRILQHVGAPRLLMAALAATRGNQIRRRRPCSASTATRWRKKIRDLDIQVVPHACGVMSSGPRLSSRNFAPKRNIRGPSGFATRCRSFCRPLGSRLFSGHAGGMPFSMTPLDRDDRGELSFNAAHADRLPAGVSTRGGGTSGIGSRLRGLTKAVMAARTVLDNVSLEVASGQTRVACSGPFGLRQDHGRCA